MRRWLRLLAKQNGVWKTLKFPLLQKTARGVRFKLIADEIAGVASQFSKIRNLSPALENQTLAIKAQLADFKARSEAVAGLSEDVVDSRKKTIKNIDRLYKRFDDGTIFPPDAFDGVEQAVGAINQQKRTQQGGLRVVRATMFGGGYIVKAKTQCSEQGSGRWLPKPTDVLATFGRIANPNIGFKDVPLIWGALGAIVGYCGFPDPRLCRGHAPRLLPQAQQRRIGEAELQNVDAEHCARQLQLAVDPDADRSYVGFHFPRADGGCSLGSS